MSKTLVCLEAIVVLVAVVESSMAAETVPITIESIRCQKTETVFGSDKTYFVVSSTSDKGVTSEIHKLNDNEVWKVNREVLKVERGKPVAITVWDGDRFFNKNKDKIALLVGEALGALGTAATSGADAGTAVEIGKELVKEFVKRMKDPDDLVLSGVINTDKDRFFVLHQRRGETWRK